MLLNPVKLNTVLLIGRIIMLYLGRIVAINVEILFHFIINFIIYHIWLTFTFIIVFLALHICTLVDLVLLYLGFFYTLLDQVEG